MEIHCGVHSVIMQCLQYRPGRNKRICTLCARDPCSACENSRAVTSHWAVASSSPAISCLSSTMGATTAAACRDTEGWGPLSLRPFDLTPCFEEGIIFPIPLVLLLVSALFRSWSLKSRERHQHAHRVNRCLLVVKLVRLYTLQFHLNLY